MRTNIMDNEYIREIEQAIENITDDESVGAVFDALRSALINDNEFVVPIEWEDESGYMIRTISHDDDLCIMPIFTSMEEIEKGQPTLTKNVGIEDLLEQALMNEPFYGVVINPWGNHFTLDKDYIRMLFDSTIPETRENVICIAKEDITKSEAECIVNAANETLLGGGGVDGAIHRAAGPGLLEECRTLNGCRTSEAKITKGYNLKAKYVIHTVGPIYSGKPEDAEMLRRCYWNSLELARKNDIHSIAFPAISTGVYGYPKEDAALVALVAVSDWMKINPDYGMAIIMSCFDDETVHIYESIWAEIEERWNEGQHLTPEEGNALVNEAIKFAVEKHAGAFRKGTDKPYIVHPVEALQILSNITNDYKILAAAVLHDTLEDTETSLYEITTFFGNEVAYLVKSHTENKDKIWYVRKKHTIEELKKANLAVKIVAFADKLANLRSLHADYKKVGEELWDRFNASKQWQSWYYSELQDAFYEFQEYAETEELYWEMVGRYKDIFVKFFIDEMKGEIYQFSACDQKYVFRKETLNWEPFDGFLTDGARPIPRKEAEMIEDNWAESFEDTKYLN